MTHLSGPMTDSARTEGAPEELRGVLTAHARRYPVMAPCDAVKLIFQNEFGGGHSIADPAQHLASLRSEHAATAHDPSAPLLEDIGNGVVRVMLAALDPNDYPLEELSRDFIRSAQLHQGSMESFLQKLEVLRQLVREGALPFSSEALEDYLEPYLRSGCPPVSHSPAYRRAYRPAYRIVVRSACLPLLLHHIRALCARQERVLVAIDGRCASGKTTLARRLAEGRGWATVHMDHFFLRPEQRTAARYALPGGNIDHERFLTQLLLPLRRGGTPVYRPFDCQTQRLCDPIPFVPTQVTIVEGSYSCHPALRDRYDLRVFLTVDPDVQIQRILTRDGAEHAETFRQKWIPLEERYFEACQVEAACDYRLQL